MPEPESDRLSFLTATSVVTFSSLLLAWAVITNNRVTKTVQPAKNILQQSTLSKMKSIAAKFFIAVLAVVIVPFTVVGWHDEEMKEGGQQERNLRAANPFSSKTIVEVAVGAAPEFETLVAAVTAAGLVNALSGPGPFTVFG